MHVALQAWMKVCSFELGKSVLCKSSHSRHPPETLASSSAGCRLDPLADMTQGQVIPSSFFIVSTALQRCSNCCPQVLVMLSASPLLCPESPPDFNGGPSEPSSEAHTFDRSCSNQWFARIQHVPTNMVSQPITGKLVSRLGAGCPGPCVPDVAERSCPRLRSCAAGERIPASDSSIVSSTRLPLASSTSSCQDGPFQATSFFRNTSCTHNSLMLRCRTFPEPTHVQIPLPRNDHPAGNDNRHHSKDDGDVSLLSSLSDQKRHCVL